MHRGESKNVHNFCCFALKKVVPLGVRSASPTHIHKKRDAFLHPLYLLTNQNYFRLCNNSAITSCLSLAFKAITISSKVFSVLTEVAFNLTCLVALTFVAE